MRQQTQDETRNHITLPRTQKRMYAFFDCHGVRKKSRSSGGVGTDQNPALIDRRRPRVIKGIPHISIRVPDDSSVMTTLEGTEMIHDAVEVVVERRGSLRARFHAYYCPSRFLKGERRRYVFCQVEIGEREVDWGV